MFYRSFSASPLRLPLHSCIVFHLRDSILINSFLVGIHFCKHPKGDILREKIKHQSFDVIAEFSFKGIFQNMILPTNNCVRSSQPELGCDSILACLGSPSCAHGCPSYPLNLTCKAPAFVGQGDVDTSDLCGEGLQKPYHLSVGVLSCHLLF